MTTKIKYKAKHDVLIRKGQDAAEAVGKKFGAFVMTTARQSIRKSNKPSQPGQPPRSKTGTLKRNIVFDYDAQSRSVVIGAQLLGGVASQDAAQSLEQGGTSVVLKKGKRRRQRVARRAFMLPALEKRQSELPLLWQNAIK